jgi:myosin-5
MMDAKKGMQVWWNREEDGGKEWIRGVVVRVEEDGVTVTAEGSRDEERIDTGALVMANPAMLDGVGDLTMLSFLHEPGILDVLQKRFQDVYTHAGPVLVAINPFTSVDLYSDEYVKKYVKRPAMGEGSRGYAPHIFLTADQAFKQVSSLGAFIMQL